MAITEAPFDSELELENWTLKNITNILGDCVCLPKFQITTSSGKKGIPDGSAFNFVTGNWYVLECELLEHGVWPHIAEQITRFVVALQNRETLRDIRDRLFEYVIEQNLVAKVTSQFQTSDERLLQQIELFIEGVQPSVVIIIDDTNKDLIDFARALETPTRIYRVKKFIVNGQAEYYSPDHEAPVIETSPDEKAVTGGQDYDVVEQLGGGTTIAGVGRFTCYRLADGRTIHIKRSKFHERQNYYWYGISPNALQQAQELGVTHFVFVMGNSGFVVVPLSVVIDYCATTKSTKHQDGTIRHFHALISPEPDPELFWSVDAPRYDLQEYFHPFA
jgi:hypothetical protein